MLPSGQEPRETKLAKNDYFVEFQSFSAFMHGLVATAITTTEMMVITITTTTLTMIILYYYEFCMQSCHELPL